MAVDQGEGERLSGIERSRNTGEVSRFCKHSFGFSSTAPKPAAASQRRLLLVGRALLNEHVEQGSAYGTGRDGVKKSGMHEVSTKRLSPDTSGMARSNSSNSVADPIGE